MRQGLRAVASVSVFFVLTSCGKSESTTPTPPLSSSPDGPVECLAAPPPSAVAAITGHQERYPGISQKTGFEVSPFIVGGNVVTGLTPPAGDNTVAIYMRQKGQSQLSLLCTGTVVADNLILTAAHCFNSVDSADPSPGVVVFGNRIGTSPSAQISCWQRQNNYIDCEKNPVASCFLNDIAWVKIAGSASSYNYVAASVLSHPESALSSSEIKTMAGFGSLDDEIPNQQGLKYIVDTSAQGHPDVLPDGAVDLFNSLTFQGAFANYLTVIGPYLGHGTCFGDSGGPVYVQRNGQFVLAALTQGSNNLLTPKPFGSYPNYTFDTSQLADCHDGYGLYTTVGNYLNWIQVTSGVSLTTFP